MYVHINTHTYISTRLGVNSSGYASGARVRHLEAPLRDSVDSQIAPNSGILEVQNLEVSVHHNLIVKVASFWGYVLNFDDLCPVYQPMIASRKSPKTCWQRTTGCSKRPSLHLSCYNFCSVRGYCDHRDYSDHN